MFYKHIRPSRGQSRLLHDCCRPDTNVLGSWVADMPTTLGVTTPNTICMYKQTDAQYTMCYKQVQYTLQKPQPQPIANQHHATP